MMGDTEGTFRITYRDRDAGEDITLDFGSITNIDCGATKALSTIPLVSMGADRAFQLETGSTVQYNVSFKRKSPDEFDNTSSDSTQWSNAHWYHAVTALVDRWQMRTNGCRVTYKPSLTNPYVPQIDVNGYIKMLSRKYSNKFNELIEGSIQIIVGTMYVLSPMKSDVPEQQDYKTLILHSGVSSETLRGKYLLEDVIYSMSVDVDILRAPPTPPEWSMYANALGKEVSSWSINGSSLINVTVGNNLGTSAFSDVIELTANWG